MIYVVSILALRAESSEGIQLSHAPVLIGAASLDEAATLVSEIALNRYKPEDGWYNHQAAILPSTKAIQKAIETLAPNRGEAVEDEGYAQVFTFSASAPPQAVDHDEWPETVLLPTDSPG
jgi:hypothetical protein